jgi:hypothetical protein
MSRSTYNVSNEFLLFFRFIAIKIGQKVAESSDVILPRSVYTSFLKLRFGTRGQCNKTFFVRNFRIFVKS